MEFYTWNVIYRMVHTDHCIQNQWFTYTENYKQKINRTIWNVIYGTLYTERYIQNVIYGTLYTERYIRNVIQFAKKVLAQGLISH